MTKIDEEPDGPGFTCRFTAGLRHVETTMVPNPVLEDPLALHLCGSAALALAMKELEDLTAAQGSGKHLRVPARTRLLDDRVADALQKIAHNSSNGLSSSSGQAHHLANVQIVALGCGMDTRPWRLPLHEDKSGCVVSWFDVDLPAVAHIKATSLAAAGAGPLNQEIDYRPDSEGNIKSWRWSCGEGAPTFPLQSASYSLVGADLGKTALSEALAALGHNSSIPTIWVLEAVVYYLPLQAAGRLWEDMMKLCPPGSIQIVTCVDSELLEASRSKVSDNHVFANLWHFDVDDMLTCTQFASFWRNTSGEPRTTKQLALEELGVETYVALYGGAECVVVAERM